MTRITRRGVDLLGVFAGQSRNPGLTNDILFVYTCAYERGFKWSLERRYPLRHVLMRTPPTTVDILSRGRSTATGTPAHTYRTRLW